MPATHSVQRQTPIPLVFGKVNQKWRDIRQTNYAYRHWMRHMYLLYFQKNKMEKTAFTRSLVEYLRRDNISCLKRIPGTGELVEMSDKELRLRLAQAFCEKWVKRDLIEENAMEPLSFRTFLLGTPHEIQKVYDMFRREE
ncbi:predicted protein [Chaetoceros tenuissimus]|uniref:Uncharacterized protein n=1 Tax=Chaetoceros tenuissimus TaxID=426638 RepID=A0AAD3DDI6_9STRA|nr:predicted protein [Chaetoceros tenuissimus]